MKPKRIILIRHGESAGNANPYVYENTPDHKVPLTQRGIEQSKNAGREIKSLIGRESIQFYVSPYTRTRQTAENIISVLSGNNWRWREDPRIREQEYGSKVTVEGVKVHEEKKADFGSFFYRMPNGESGADVFDRISTFFESMHRDFEKDCFPDNAIICSHGFAIRVILMRYFRWTVEQFENLKNPLNCQMFTLEKNTQNKYQLTSPIKLKNMELYYPAKELICSQAVAAAKKVEVFT